MCADHRTASSHDRERLSLFLGCIKHALYSPASITMIEHEHELRALPMSGDFVPLGIQPCDHARHSVRLVATCVCGDLACVAHALSVPPSRGVESHLRRGVDSVWSCAFGVRESENNPGLQPFIVGLFEGRPR